MASTAAAPVIVLTRRNVIQSPASVCVLLDSPAVGVQAVSFVFVHTPRFLFDTHTNDTFLSELARVVELHAYVERELSCC